MVLYYMCSEKEKGIIMMDLEDIEKRKSALGTILAQMNVPEANCDFDGPRAKRNLLWMTRNLSINNRNHPLLQTAMIMIKEILKNT